MAKGPGGFSVGRVSIQVVPDTSKFRQKLLAELKKEVKGIKVEIPVDVDMAKAVTQLKALDSILKKIDGRNVNIGATVSSKGDLSKIAKDLGKVGSSASDAADGFGKMSRVALIFSAVVVLLAPALALIATLIAGLPSLMFAFGFAALAVGLGIEGIKKAASGFAPTIERLKKSLSKTFADQLTKPFIELNKLAPVLDSGLNKIAVSLSGIISGLIGVATSGQGMAQLNTILQNTAKFFAQLTPAFTDGFRAFNLLASEASQKFDILAGTLNKFSAGFLDVVGRVTGDGTLEAALEGLNSVLNSLLQGFNKLFEAGLNAMGVLGGPMSALLDGFIDAVVALMPILTAISSVVFTVLGEAFKQLVPIFEELTPVFQILAEMLGEVLTTALKALGPLLLIVAQILSQVLLKALAAIGPFIGPFLDFVTQLAVVVGDFLLTAFTAILPFLTQFFTFLTQILMALTPLLPKLLEFATVVLTALGDALVDLAPSLINMGNEIFPKLMQVMTDLVPLVSRAIDIFIQLLPPIIELAGFILEYVIPAFTAMFNTVQETWPQIQQIIDGVITFIKGVLDLFIGFLTGDMDRAWRGLEQIVKGAWEGIKGTIKLGITALLEAVIAIPGRILGVFTGLPADLARSGRAMMQGLVDGIVSMGKNAVNAALGVVRDIRNLLPFSPAKTGPFSGTGYTLYSGRALMEDWAKGIQQGAPSAVSAVEEAMAATQTGMDISAAVTSEGFGDLQGQITSAMSGWEVVIDANGITKLVNRTNQKNARR